MAIRRAWLAYELAGPLSLRDGNFSNALGGPFWTKCQEAHNPCVCLTRHGGLPPRYRGVVGLCPGDLARCMGAVVGYCCSPLMHWQAR